MRRLWAKLPGPSAAKLGELIVLLVLLLVGLFFLFEWAGDFLDTGGVVGP